MSTVQQVHCSRRRLLRRGLEFHVCTINKSAHTKKVWKLIVWTSYKQYKRVQFTFNQILCNNILLLKTLINMNVCHLRWMRHALASFFVLCQLYRFPSINLFHIYILKRVKFLQSILSSKILLFVDKFYDTRRVLDKTLGHICKLRKLQMFFFEDLTSVLTKNLIGISLWKFDRQQIVVLRITKKLKSSLKTSLPK